jgi:large subunit ribosomal protein L11
MIIKLLVDGGEMKPGPTIAQKIGPLGLNMGKIIQEINKATAKFKGTKVPVNLDVEPKTKEFKVEVFSPPTSEMLKKELGIETASGDHKKSKVGNLAIEQIIKIAETKHSNMLAKDFKSAVKSVVGSCVSLGVLVENKSGKEIESDIDEGKFDKEIKERKTEATPEKMKLIKEHFENVLKEQEMIKKAEEAKAAEEAAKAAAATPATTAKATEGADAKAPVEAKKETAGKTADVKAPVGKAKEEKKK